MSYEEYLNSNVYYEEEMLLAIAIILIIGIIAAFVAWLITLYPRYYMVKTSGVGPVWTAFIPIWQDIQLFKMAGWPWWSYWVYLIGFSVAMYIPFLNIFAPIGLFVFLCVLYWRVSANFGLGTWGRILSLIFGWWVYWYVALTKKPYIAVYGGYMNSSNDQNWYQSNNAPQQPDNSWYQKPIQPEQTQQNWYQQQNDIPEQ